MAFRQLTTMWAWGGPVPLDFIQGVPFVPILLFPLQLAGPLPTDFVPPSPAQGCRIYDQGVSIVVQVLDGNGDPVNLRAASAQGIVLVRPSGVGVDVGAVYYTNGIDGQMSFMSGSELPLGTGIDEAGTWLIQGHVTISGNTQFTTVGAFTVSQNLPGAII